MYIYNVYIHVIYIMAAAPLPPLRMVSPRFGQWIAHVYHKGPNYIYISLLYVHN